MSPLTKEQFYDKVSEMLGDVLHIPPIEYCLMKNGERYQKFLFVNGNCVIEVLRHCKGFTVHVIDEWEHWDCFNVKEFKELLTFT